MQVRLRGAEWVSLADGADGRGELEIEIPQVREAAETFASKLFPRTPKLLRTEPLKALVIGAFVRGLSMRDVESLCDQAGLGKLSKSTASRMCEELRERFDAFQRRGLYDINLVALFLDASIRDALAAVVVVMPTRGPRARLTSAGLATRRHVPTVLQRATRGGQRSTHDSGCADHGFGFRDLPPTV